MERDAMCQTETRKKNKPCHERILFKKKSPLIYFWKTFISSHPNHPPQGAHIGSSDDDPIAMTSWLSRLAGIEPTISRSRVDSRPPELFCLCVLGQPLSSKKQPAQCCLLTSSCITPPRPCVCAVCCCTRKPFFWKPLVSLSFSLFHSTTLVLTRKTFSHSYIKWIHFENKWWSTSSSSLPDAPGNRLDNCYKQHTGNSR